MTVYRTMPFGKHKGEPIASLPDDYIEWLLWKTTIKAAWLREALLNEQKSRSAPQKGDPDVHAKKLEIVTAGYRALAKKYHPDTGGNETDMKALNHAVAEFREELKGI